MLKWALCKVRDAVSDIMVKSLKAVVYLPFKPFDKPCFKPANSGLHGCFVLGFYNPCRNDGYAIMACELPICVVDIRIIKACVYDGCFAVVRDKHPGTTSIPFKGIYMSLIPEQLCFIRESFNKRI